MNSCHSLKRVLTAAKRADGRRGGCLPVRPTFKDVGCVGRASKIVHLQASERAFNALLCAI